MPQRRLKKNLGQAQRQCSLRRKTQKSVVQNCPARLKSSPLHLDGNLYENLRITTSQVVSISLRDWISRKSQSFPIRKVAAGSPPGASRRVAGALGKSTPAHHHEVFSLAVWSRMRFARTSVRRNGEAHSDEPGARSLTKDNPREQDGFKLRL